MRSKLLCLLFLAILLGTVLGTNINDEATEAPKDITTVKPSRKVKSGNIRRKLETASTPGSQEDLNNNNYYQYYINQDNGANYLAQFNPSQPSVYSYTVKPDNFEQNAGNAQAPFYYQYQHYPYPYINSDSYENQNANGNKTIKGSDDSMTDAIGSIIKHTMRRVFGISRDGEEQESNPGIFARIRALFSSGTEEPLDGGENFTGLLTPSGPSDSSALFDVGSGNELTEDDDSILGNLGLSNIWSNFRSMSMTARVGMGLGALGWSLLGLLYFPVMVFTVRKMGGFPKFQGFDILKKKIWQGTVEVARQFEGNDNKCFERVVCEVYGRMGMGMYNEEYYLDMMESSRFTIFRRTSSAVNAMKHGSNCVEFSCTPTMPVTSMLSRMMFWRNDDSKRRKKSRKERKDEKVE